MVDMESALQWSRLGSRKTFGMELTRLCCQHNSFPDTTLVALSISHQDIDFVGKTFPLSVQCFPYPEGKPQSQAPAG